MSPLFDFYEKLYFHEIDMREKLAQRLQIPLAIIISLLGAIGYILQNIDVDTPDNWMFWVVGLSVFFAAGAAFYFTISWFGNPYKFVPSAKDTEDYRILLIDTYKVYQNGDVLAANYFNDYLRDKYIECSTQNTKSNDIRSLRMHRMSLFIIASAFFISISFVLFFVDRITHPRVMSPVKVVLVDSPRMAQNSEPLSPQTFEAKPDVGGGIKEISVPSRQSEE